MKLLTYNAKSCKCYAKNSSLPDERDAGNVIKRYNADIVCLNEIHGKCGKYGEQIHALAEISQMPFYFFASAIEVNGSLYGNGFLSKYPIISAETIIIPAPIVKDAKTHYESRCIGKITVRAEEKLDCFITHFGLTEKERDNAARLLLELTEKTNNKYIAMGDFNAEPDSRHIKLLKERFCDTADSNHIGSLNTFPSNSPDRKIDYIMTDRRIKTKCCGVIKTMVSDHYPYFAEIEEVLT